MKFENLSGQKFNNLLVIKKVLNTTRTTWECLCDCGNYTKVESSKLKSGHTKTCGCLKKQAVFKNNINNHNLCNTIEYSTWVGIKNRVLNIKSKNYKDYGGRGITISDNWKNDFLNFYNDMGLKPKPHNNYSIDRINNNKGYYKENCRWALLKEQAINRRNSIYITFNKETKHLQDWAKQYNLKTSTLYQRLYIKKWDLEKAFTQPLNAHKHLQKRRNNSLNTSGTIGVIWRKSRSKWVASIKYNKKLKILGSFTNYNDAVITRKMAEFEQDINN